jgi:predicted 3-demethylubiquinone-9 3-methyltransferase (glyoxalase superfamily)
MKPITPCLWFDGKAEEAARFYTGIFKNSKITDISHYSEAGKEQHGQKPGSVMVVAFEINGQPFVGLNGGPIYKFTEAVSLQVPCESQEEIDYYWEKLQADGGSPVYCGWLKDKYGLSWQVFPDELNKMHTDPDRAKADRVMLAMMSMVKMDLAALRKAYNGD